MPVHAKAGLGIAPIVVILPVLVVFGAAGETHAVDAIVEAVAVAAAVTGIDEALLFVSSARGNQRSVGLFGVLGNDVDDAIHRIRSPDRTARPADHLDPVDVLHHGVLNVPIRPVEKGRINGAAVDQHQYGSRQIGPKTANSDRPYVGVDAGDLHARRQPQRFRDAGGSGPPDILAGDDVDGRRGVEGLHRLLGRRGDFDLRQLFEA